MICVHENGRWKRTQKKRHKMRTCVYEVDTASVSSKWLVASDLVAAAAAAACPQNIIVVVGRWRVRACVRVCFMSSLISLGFKFLPQKYYLAKNALRKSTRKNVYWLTLKIHCKNARILISKELRGEKGWRDEWTMPSFCFIHWVFYQREIGVRTQFLVSLPWHIAKRFQYV